MRACYNWQETINNFLDVSYHSRNDNLVKTILL